MFLARLRWGAEVITPIIADAEINSRAFSSIIIIAYQKESEIVTSNKNRGDTKSFKSILLTSMLSFSKRMRWVWSSFLIILSSIIDELIQCCIVKMIAMIMMSWISC